MSLKGKFSQDFRPQIRDRGVAYFRSNAVEIISHSSTQVDARVKGSVNYLVRLRLGRISLDISCTCPYFEKGEECKHIWATMLAADSRQYLNGIDLRPRLQLRFDDEAREELIELGDSSSDKSQIDQFQTRPKQVTAQTAPWERQLSAIASSIKATSNTVLDEWSTDREIYYVIDPSAFNDVKLNVEIGYRTLTNKGDWGKIKTHRLPTSAISKLPDLLDQQILNILSGAKDEFWSNQYYGHLLPSKFSLTNPLQDLLLPLMCATGRCVLRTPDKNKPFSQIFWDAGPAWKFWLVVERDPDLDEYKLQPVLRRADSEISLADVLLATDRIFIQRDHRAGLIEGQGTHAWTNSMRRSEQYRIPATQAPDLIATLLDLPGGPEIQFPEELQLQFVTLTPRPHLVVRKPENAYWPQTRLEADLVYHYEEMPIRFSDERSGLYDRNTSRYVVRDSEAEAKAVSLLKTLGFKFSRDYNRNQRIQLLPKSLPKAVVTLMGAGWKVEAEGRLYRNPGTSNVSVSSGIDWFELHGSLNFGEGLDVKLPALLNALKRGESMIALGDGSFGLLPEEWLQKYGLLASFGEAEGDHLRFKRTQTGVLDALLASQPEITFDEQFARVRSEWQNFKGITAVAEPKGFVGTLRDYQREGLGWFEFLQRFGFGGCLADDMGLGKTVQVLALLESRRNGQPKPSLVVVPRSLIFNWQQEAERFTPGLRVLTHAGAERTKRIEDFKEYDLIITTYGTLRRDAQQFQDVGFDFVILDEAQAIKNAKTESAKAVRLLKGNHRLALSGTPIENHLGELWSLFEFLNPGMLGAASVFQLSTNGSRSPDAETRGLLSRALRPFMLRRTKQQVAKELPEKLEQTIYCEMDEIQRRQYDELRSFYRASLLETVERVGLKRSKIQILEALLRLRQTACHPALVDGGADDGPNAKLDVLLPQLSDVTQEGHKALVFSQFTSFLSIVKKRLDTEGITYEYLDGKTRNRGLAVERFQNDPDCKLFLISLKAGGQGLNLTAAEYVFLLDPWWNPAVEAQAIDRAHRIGQARRVFAYRLITRDTVEEKVLALQATKRDLADAILSADNSVLKNITGDDLMLLLS
jgi:superfamily II DNA or RNA helicase